MVESFKTIVVQLGNQAREWVIKTEGRFKDRDHQKGIEEIRIRFQVIRVKTWEQ